MGMLRRNQTGVGVLVGLLMGCGGTAETAVLASRPHWLYQVETNKNAIVAYDSRGRGAYLFVGKDGKSVLCAEPAPDASSNVSSSVTEKLAAEATVAARGINAGGKLSDETQAVLSSQLADVAQRSESVLLVRDLSYRLCEMLVNGAVEAKDVPVYYQSIMNMTARLSQRSNVSDLINLLRDDRIASDPTLAGMLVKSIVALSFAEKASDADTSVKSAEAFEALIQGVTPPAASAPPASPAPVSPPPASPAPRR